MTDDAHGWDARYGSARAAGGTEWSATPNAWVERTLGPLAPGTALDLGAGEGRNALWLAGRGWRVTAVDYSAEGIATGRSRAGDFDLEWVVADITTWRAPRLYDVVLFSFVHIAADEFAQLIRSAPLAPGGTLAIIGHDVTNSVGGPSDRSILLDPARLADAAAHLEIVTSGRVERETPHGVAVDAVLVARRGPVAEPVEAPSPGR
jgi:SAM-dependent methyltransferase